jgi:hypothetical protein
VKEAGHTAREAHLIPPIELLKQQKNYCFKKFEDSGKAPVYIFFNV